MAVPVDREAHRGGACRWWCLPYVNAAQGEHPALGEGIERLRGLGDRVLLGPDVLPLHRPRQGKRDQCPWHLTLPALKEELNGQTNLRGGLKQCHSKLAPGAFSLVRAMLDAGPRTGCVDEELTREHLYIGINRIILYRYGESMAACWRLTWRHDPPLYKDVCFRRLQF
jgi:hypothetical protein